MFSCYNDQEEDRPQPCRFREVSPCREQVSKFVCNEHAAMFGLRYRLTNYLNGDNDSWSSIDTFVSSTASFNLPLFLDQNGEILLSEIHSFALSVCNSFPNIRLEVLKNVIACLMGINAYDNNCVNGGWLEDESTRIIVQDTDGTKALRQLPPLHKMLFYYTKPGSIHSSNGDHLFLVPNIMLQYDTTNSTTATYHFVIANKKNMLKWSNRPNSVATPIVLNAIRETNVKQQTRTFKPLPTGGVWC